MRYPPRSRPVQQRVPGSRGGAPKLRRACEPSRSGCGATQDGRFGGRSSSWRWRIPAVGSDDPHAGSGRRRMIEHPGTAGPEDAGFRSAGTSTREAPGRGRRARRPRPGPRGSSPPQRWAPLSPAGWPREVAPLRIGWNQRGITKSMPGAAPAGSSREMLLTRCASAVSELGFASIQARRSNRPSGTAHSGRGRARAKRRRLPRRRDQGTGVVRDAGSS